MNDKRPDKGVSSVRTTGWSAKHRFFLAFSTLIFMWVCYRIHESHDSETFPLAGYCAHIAPISPTEVTTRQDTLANTLHQLNAAAYIAEPGASALFYGNVSWHLSERPLLLIITPEVAGDKISARVSILTPKFEATRAKQLSIPSADSNITFIEWAEEISPYETLISALNLQDNATLFIDAAARYFVVDGLKQALPKSATLSPAPIAVRRLRERKSTTELEIMKCANEVTLLAIRATHKQLYVGMREWQAKNMIAETLASAGLKDAGCLTLFGENAALPHGSGTDRSLQANDFALFDCTGFLHGYSSDVTRTVALPKGIKSIPAEHIEIWYHVLAAQTIAYRTAREGELTGKVDAAARSYLATQGTKYGPNGYAEWFSHRLGHGIGLEVHEEPYLRGGTTDVIQTGHTFSDEPGVYIETKVGVRLEDCFYINDEGDAVFLTAGVGGQAKSPFLP